VSATAIHDLATLLATDAVHSIYQPIVDLHSSPRLHRAARRASS
jgi:hypothetical protein